MNKLFPLIAACGSALLFASAAQAGCDDHVSYVVTSSGRCVDLTVFSDLGILQGKVEDMTRQAIPVIFRNVKTRSSQTGNLWITGEAVNQSRVPVYVSSFTARFTRTRELKTSIVGDEQITLAKRIEPGGIVPFKWLVTNEKLRGKVVILQDSVTGERLGVDPQAQAAAEEP